MRLLLAMAVCGCGGATTSSAHPVHDEALDRFTGATQRGDEAGVASFLGDSLTFGGLWFSDPQCLQQFPTAMKISGDQRPAFAKCLATLRLSPSKRHDALDGVDVLEYPPGIEVEAVVEPIGGTPQLTWIGYASRHDVRDALPTITATTLESLRTAGTTAITPDPAAQARLDADRAVSQLDLSYAWLKVCLDAEGKVTSVHPREVTSPAAQQIFVDAIGDWAFRPPELDGHAIPVCAMVRLVYPADKATTEEVLPVPAPSAEHVMVNFKVLGQRVAGERAIAPPDVDKVALAKAGISRVVGAFAFCLDESGAVATVGVLRSTRLHEYDQKIQRGIRGWRYRPYLVEGKPVALCSTVAFIYNQH